MARFPKRISSQLGRSQSGKLIRSKLWSNRRSGGRYQFIAPVDFLLRGQKGPVLCAFAPLCLPPCVRLLPLPRLAPQRILSLTCTHPRHSRLCKHCAWARSFAVFHRFARTCICTNFPCRSRVFWQAKY